MSGNRLRYFSAASIGPWTALNAQYRKNGSALCFSMNAKPSRANASVRYSFSGTASLPRKIAAVTVRAAEEPEELVEAPVLRVELLLGVPEVPLADEPRLVARGLEPVGESGLGQRQSDAGGRVGRRAGVELVPVALLVAAGEHP